MMHVDKIISSIALMLNIFNWNTISLITGSILAVVMIVYYVIRIYQRLKENKHYKNKENDENT